MYVPIVDNLGSVLPGALGDPENMPPSYLSKAHDWGVSVPMPLVKEKG